MSQIIMSIDELQQHPITIMMNKFKLELYNHLEYLLIQENDV